MRALRCLRKLHPTAHERGDARATDMCTMLAEMPLLRMKMKSGQRRRSSDTSEVLVFVQTSSCSGEKLR